MGKLFDLETFWLLDLAATGAATALFLAAGILLRRHAAVAHCSRPIALPTGSRLLKSLRPRRLRPVEAMAQGLLTDVGGILVEGPHRHPEARALLPIVSEVRRFGETLVKSRRFLVTLLAPAREARLAPLVRDLSRVEMLLRELPRSRLTLEDVLAGRFETENWT
jgi:hypothetical protein